MGAEPEHIQSEPLADEEPRYLRRKRQVEIRRRRFGRRSWQFYRRVLVTGAGVLAGGWLLYEAGHFLLFSPQFALSSPSQIEIVGNHHVSRASVLEKFFPDRDRSVLRIPLDARRRSLEELPWVEQAGVERILPNRIRVELVERKPVAFLRVYNDLALVDAHGVILERPPVGDFRFPVVSGLSEAMPPAAREQRMQLFVEFVSEMEQVRPGASGHLSEVDLSDSTDLRATLTGLRELGATPNDPAAVLVHFGDGDFLSKYRLFAENLAQWRAVAGRVESVDLRFARQVVVNPEPGTMAHSASPEGHAGGRSAPAKRQ